MINLYKYTVKFILVTALILVHQGCADLDEDLGSVLSLGNLHSEGDIIAALAPIYREYEKVIDKPHEVNIIGFGSDDITTWWAGNKAPLRVFDRFDYGNGENSDIIWLDVAWNGYWKVIYYTNTLIDALKTSEAPDELNDIADAEARFFRALSYYNLVRSWGNVPIIPDGYTPTGEEVRATVLENYQEIEKDLIIAESALPAPENVNNIGRVSSAAAKTLLANLYLTWSGWPVKDNTKYQLAANKAKEVIDMDYFELLPIDELWLLQNQNSLESIFSMQFSEVEDIRNEWPANTSFHEARGWSDMYPERQFFYDFPEGARKQATFYTEIPQRGVADGQIVENDPPTVPWQESQRKHPMYKKFAISENLTVGNRTVGYRAWEVFRYAEVLLIYAEAQARVDGGIATGEALEALNQIRRRAAGLNYLTPVASVDLVTATADQIVEEKGWELAGECKRWFDLVRLEKVAEATQKRDPTEEVPLAIDASEISWQHFIAPIPFKTISTSRLVQNPEGFEIQ